MKLLILLDKKASGKKARIDKALELIKADYEGVTNVTWEYEERDYSDVAWEPYLPGYFGLNFNYVSDQTKAIWDKNRYDYDHVIFTIDPDNWRAPGIGGWNLGGRFNFYYPQIVKVSNSDYWLYRIFAMEIFHAMDEIVLDEMKVNLDKIAGTDFDNGVVHGEDPRYGVTNAESHTGYFTDYLYRPEILQFKPYITPAYLAREKRRIERQTLMLKLVEALTKLVDLLKLQEATPFLFKPHTH